jgi:hypothetical protein
MTRARTIATALVIAATLGACTKARTGFDAALPGTQTPQTVTAVTMRGPYLEASLRMDQYTLEAWVLPSEACAAVFEVGADVRYAESGPLGTYRRGDLECQALGAGNLELWRDRSSRATPAGVPRAEASFQVLHADDEVALLRGSFPLAGQLGFTGSSDLVAVVPRVEECEAPIAKGVASLEYRGKGPRALSLVGERGLCVIRALVQPPPRAQAEP